MSVVGGCAASPSGPADGKEKEEAEKDQVAAQPAPDGTRRGAEADDGGSSGAGDMGEPTMWMPASSAAACHQLISLALVSVNHVRDPAEYGQQMAVEIRHLRRSARYYDDGDESEGQRLAISIRKLVYDCGQSVSLLTHLGVKSNLRFVDTAPRMSPGLPPGTIMLHAGLVIIQTMLESREGTHFVPPLDNLPPNRRNEPAEFDEWWTATVVADQEGNRFSRSVFVLGVANQDGGAHIDSTLGAAYGAITRAGSLGIKLAGPGGEMRPCGQSLALATVRQIAWELEPTLLACCDALRIDINDG